MGKRRRGTSEEIRKGGGRATREDRRGRKKGCKRGQDDKKVQTRRGGERRLQMREEEV